jgi:hypothetical protein
VHDPVVGFAALRRRVRPGAADEVHDAIMPPGGAMAPAGPARRSGVNDYGAVAEMHSFRAQRADPPYRVAPGQDVTGLPGGSLAATGFSVLPRRVRRAACAHALVGTALASPLPNQLARPTAVVRAAHTLAGGWAISATRSMRSGNALLQCHRLKETIDNLPQRHGARPGDHRYAARHRITRARRGQRPGRLDRAEPRRRGQ